MEGRPPTPVSLSPLRVVLVGLSVVLTIGAAVALSAALLDVVDGPGGPDPAVALTLLLSPIWVASVGFVSLLLNFRRPGNRIGSLFAVLGPLLGFVNGVWAYSWPVPAGFELEYEWLSVVASFYVVALAGPGLALLFPDGRLPSPRWRIPVAVVATTYAVSVLLLSLTPRALEQLAPPDAPELPVDPAAVEAFGISALEPFAPLLDTLAFGSVIILGALGIAAIVSRRRHGGSLVRAQLRWFLLATALIPSGIALSVIQSGLDPGSESVVGVLILYSGFALTPVAVAIAILRYRLYEIDVIIRRTVVYTMLSAVLAATYGLGVLTMQVFVSPMADGDPVGIAASTLAAAAVFQPARRRIQAVVDRRFYRSRYDAGRTLQAFSRRLRDDVELERLVADLADVVDRTVQSSSVSVWVRSR